jgi:hypothetical protein
MRRALTSYQKKKKKRQTKGNVPISQVQIPKTEPNGKIKESYSRMGEDII